MAIGGLVVFGLGTAFLMGLAWYASRHRAEDRHRLERARQGAREKAARHRAGA